jgi:polygalacturonase
MKIVSQKCVLLLSLWILVTAIPSCIQKEKNNAITSTSFTGYDDVQGFKMPIVAEPVIPDNTVLITDFGAVNDGQTLNTKAISDAIDAVSKKGGGNYGLRVRSS